MTDETPKQMTQEEDKKVEPSSKRKPLAAWDPMGDNRSFDEQMLPDIPRQ